MKQWSRLFGGRSNIIFDMDGQGRFLSVLVFFKRSLGMSVKQGAQLKRYEGKDRRDSTVSTLQPSCRSRT